MTEHYFTKEQTSPFRPERIQAKALGIEISLYTAGGVFSPTHMDPGTKLLIESAKIGEGWKVLDLGCGYGIVGIAIKKKNPSVQMVMTDVNERALELARMNIKLNKTEAEIFHGNGFENKRLDAMRFDTILLNPPQTAGKEVCLRMIDESFRHLNPGGTLQLVARHNKGGKSLSEYMESVFGNVHDVEKSGGYRVYASEKKR